MGRVGEGKNSNFLKFHSKFTENRPRTTPGKHKYSSDPPPPGKNSGSAHDFISLYYKHCPTKKRGKWGRAVRIVQNSFSTSIKKTCSEEKSLHNMFECHIVVLHTVK